MKNQWLNFFSGSVKILVKGKGIERLINDCVRNDIHIWNVRRYGTQSLSFFMLLDDVKKIRPIVRKSDCKIEFVGRKGFPFLIKKSILNSGFVLGGLFFFVLIGILSNMVWGIEVRGAKPKTEHLIRKELREIGVEKGKFQFLLTDVESIQRQLTNNIEEITWIGVELKGTTYHFEVVEKKQPESPEQLSPRNIVAKKKAIITDMFVEEGHPLVQVNDYVEKGQILVSGAIGKEDNKQYVTARGEIFGETWYKSDVTIALKTKFSVFTGNYKTKHFIKIFNTPIQIWGYGSTKYKSFEIEKTENKLKFLKWNLPIAYEKQIMRENESISREYTLEEAVEAAKEIGRSELKSKLASDSIIKSEKVLRQTDNNGKVKLEIYFKVIENIVTTIPLVQGD
ncbi:sporulation protein YqfD [Bacillus timonensis]|nr:sporulation protein YqfD [Bacillus timonensis]